LTQCAEDELNQRRQHNKKIIGALRGTIKITLKRSNESNIGPEMLEFLSSKKQSITSKLTESIQNDEYFEVSRKILFFIYFKRI
jgi:hypothetical protein